MGLAVAMVFLAVTASTWCSQCGRYRIEATVMENGLPVYTVSVNDVPRHVDGSLRCAIDWCTDQEAAWSCH